MKELFSLAAYSSTYFLHRMDEGNVFTSERLKGFAKLDLDVCQVTE
jgi:hypothetical protein